MICDSPTVRLVNHCFTSSTSRTNRTGRGLVYTITPSNDLRFTNCTTRKPLFHHPYESNESYGKEDAIIRIVSVRVYWTTLVLYGEPPPRGRTPYPFVYHFNTKGTPFVYLQLKMHLYPFPSEEHIASLSKLLK